MSTFNNNKGSNLPAGINIAHTSFGHQQQQGTYTPSFQGQSQLKIDTTAQHRKGKPGGGWDDDDDIQPTLSTGNGAGGLIKPTYVTSTTTTTTTTNTATTNVSSTNNSNSSFGFVSKSTKLSDLELADVDDKFLQNHEYEHKLILDTIQPGGARLKQADTVLNTFLKAAETLNVSVVGSIIISKLKSDNVFVSKARAIYDIETLVKKIGKYFDFFKKNLSALKGIDFSSTESNSSYVSQLNTILQSVTKFIEDPQAATAKPTAQNQPYSPNIQNDTANLLEMDETAPQKKSDAFGFIKSGSQSSQNTSTDSSPKKANAFGFIGGSTNTQPQQQQQPQQQKKNAFGFIGQTQNVQSTQQQQQQEPPKNSTQSRYEFLDMDFNDNSTNTMTNQNTAPKVDIGSLYGTSNNKQSGGFGGGLGSIDFGTTPQQQQQQSGGYGYGSGPNQSYGNTISSYNTSGYNQNTGGYGQSPGGFNQNTGGYNQNAGGFNQGAGGYGQNTGGFNQNAGGFNQGYNQNSMGYNQNSMGFNQNTGGFNQSAGGSSNYNYQGLQNQFGGMNLGVDANAEAEKAKKQQQEQEAKFFNFVKF